MNLNEKKYKEEIASILKINPANIFLYWKGRVALYAILKAMGIKEKDEIILPGFTCVVVPNAIIYLGAKPVYVDISPHNYNMNIDKLKEAITPRTKVILCQNTFGLSSNVDCIVDIAKEKSIYTIEDCTHGFGGYYNGKPNGSYCDAAFFSTQWNKPFSTGIGGFLIINNDLIRDKINDIEKEKIKVHLGEQIILELLILFKKYFINSYTQSGFVKLFRFLSKRNLIIGSNQGYELNKPIMPKDYFKDISAIQIQTGLKNLKHLPELNSLRKKNAMDYTRFLKSNFKTYVNEEFFNNHLFLKYPLLVKNKESFIESAHKAKIILGDWFLSPLHPIKYNLHYWGFNEEIFPIAVEISKKIVNLPTEVKNNSRILDFLNQNLEFIE